MVLKKSLLFNVFVLFLLALFFAFIPSVSASDVLIERENIDFRISPDETAKYNITITNLEPVDKVFSFGLSISDSLKWVSYPSNVRVPASSEHSFILSVKPNPATPIGVYRLNLNVRSGEFREVLDIPVHLSFDGLFFDFVPNVNTTLSLADEIDPRDNARVLVKLRNRNPLNIEDAELRIRSDLFEGEQVIDIPPGPHLTDADAIEKELVFSMDPLKAPGEYEVVAQIYYPRTDSVISQDRQTVSVRGYSSTPTKLDTSRSALFIVNHVIEVENFGNREATPEVKLASSWFKNLFSRSDPAASFERIEGENNLVWTPTLSPTEKKTITVTTNYWPLVIAILLIIALVVAYFKLRSPVIVEKEVAVVDEDEEEGSSNLRVRLFIRNRSNNSVNNLTISDKVRGITTYIESNQLGHVKPSRTTKTSKKGTMLFWDLDELEPFEERIFTYKLKSKLRVVGDLTLPRAGAKFETKNKRERRVLSAPPVFRKVKRKKVEDF